MRSFNMYVHAKNYLLSGMRCIKVMTGCTMLASTMHPMATTPAPSFVFLFTMCGSHSAMRAPRAALVVCSMRAHRAIDSVKERVHATVGT